MTSTINLKKVEEELENNPYFSKYHEKIEKLRKEQPAEYYARVKAKEKQKNSEKKKQIKYPEPKDVNPKGSSVKKFLGDILKLDMVENKSADEIKNIWMDYHKGKDVLFSTYNKEQFDKLNQNYTKYPTFVFPLPRGDGYEFFLFQYTDSELHFTPLVQFKKHGENAPECLAVTYFSELKEKDIILMRGEYDKDIVSPLDCQFLINLTQMFYNGESTKRLDLIEEFNNKPEDFKYPEIISEVERLGFHKVN